MQTFKALVVESGDPYTAHIRQARLDELPPGEVLVRVAYSSLNYKDGLAITGAGKVIRSFPMVPGIDLAGTVLESASPEYRPGDPVILTGWGLGERHWGGLAELARVRAEWLVPLPEGLTLKQAMGIGTAGFTAMLAVMALEAHSIDPAKEVLVTGAAGGVGSLAVALLAQRGYRVVASTGRLQEEAYLKSLGAHEILDRAALSAPSKPLESERFGGAVDTVGGAVLAGVLPRMAYGGSVAACGNAGGARLETTVFPFILRGVNLLGIDSVMCPKEKRLLAWQRLARELPKPLLEATLQTVSLEEVPALAQAILQGQVRGRVVVKLD
ncbi:MDR family oxidoreductase [Meiothermus taiwanensis]|jgi:acrylyl-CoA reductase (NADPH)|uniref:Quinone oxidoreductase, YhdH/YhfP family n=2 Tax=Meiothermus taiwanensis TaxID=172827 RepID=A0ABM6WEM4_9DEIN|nr:MDR family oxidoreductase [Meiothermus taiwanensis]AWR85390.1 quinone oxidoreductase, YhdH/YhfP family [Meiothermus taiwanensis WR-220]KIQ55277.1 acryloyl-CoA reductase [Meiothermus taiwanensis]KZK16522.1 acryloyl-CoA reductase [Meiothermus taiwanensis]RIH78123.1 putative acrylyl-CoA reductase AcuI [Meiothermus taiwanensis]